MHTLMNTPEDCVIISYVIQQLPIIIHRIILYNDAFIDTAIALIYIQLLTPS